ncbi:cation channel sperm-associated protein subunit gamma isoform X3 [Mesocricetus auratus]|uniref:Cation channel sperm-associated protein subunit gamma isoform X3 n=1 Tax=Mesocricetus auratus TaxID=10036 RepID=A0ABM2WHT4_MESAU|nr:cation channel sperm-associated protein subunit gamma isoform X3 [Mesocricetus auratus]
MDRRGEKRWREKVSVGTVRIAKSAWVWGDRRSYGPRIVYSKTRPGDHERRLGEDKHWGKERVIYEREYGKERPPCEDRSRGEGRPPGEERSRGGERTRGLERPRDQDRLPREKAQARETAGAEWQAGAEEKPPGREQEQGRAAHDPGRGRNQERKRSWEPSASKTQGLSRDKGRGQERKPSEEPIVSKTQGLSQDKGRGQERKPNQEPSASKTQGLSRDKGRGQERKLSQEPSASKTQGLSQGKGRGQERKFSEKPIASKTQGLSQDKGRGQERKFSEEPIYVKGRGQERQPSEAPIYKTQGPSQGPSCMVCWPAMSPVSPVWSRKPNQWAFWELLLVLLLSWKSWAVYHLQQCRWLVALNKFERVGSLLSKDWFLEQEPTDTVAEVFEKLVDSPVDPRENDEELVRKGHLMGMRPVVLISYKYPVNFYRWKIENLQIQMEAAPLRSAGFCVAEVMCALNWYAPMPIKNGSVVMSVDISSNGLEPYIPPKRFYMNMNGFLKRDASGKPIFTMGYETFIMKSAHFKHSKSRPLWYTINHSPVFILGGIEDEKTILLSDTSFQDYSLVEVSIDSCWVGSYYCPMLEFSATIHDAISTESTLFIRQNQLVYYFTGRYSTLFDNSHSSSSWVRVLASECIKKLCPVFIHGNGSEYILALTTGKHEGYIHIGTITDGLVSFQMVPERWSICDKLPGINCSINWATYIVDEKNLLLLVQVLSLESVLAYYLLSFNLETQEMTILYIIPLFIPEVQGLDFLVLDGKESYTTTAMIPKGLFFNTFNNMLYIWGNFILQSYNRMHFIFLADFPKESTIKYMVSSYQGDMAFVTENDEIWYFLEGGYDVYQIIPSKGWSIYFNLQKMHQSSLFADQEFLVSLFYEDGQLYQLIYLLESGSERLVKRVLPVAQLLLYDQNNPITLERHGNYRMPSFTNFCPFKVMRLRDLPKKQHFARQELYHAPPPLVSESLGFHNNKTLAVYQGLVYYLLWLHSKYDKPYADPVHDPTWRWWEQKTQYKDYYFYLSSNWLAAEGVYIDMSSYQKLYNISNDYGLPETVFLDKGNTFSFTIFLTSQDDTFKLSSNPVSGYQVEKKLAVAVVVADPDCLEASVNQEVLLNRKAVLYRITIKDRKVCYDQGLSGHNLKKTSMMVKVLGSSGKCFQTTYHGSSMQGHLMVPVLIGCPPGKRLAFDVTYTILHTRELNKHYFDCARMNPEMPCFLFRDLFQPFFLVQDMVTGDSGSFLGSYVLKVVGGGPTIDTIRDYTEEEIYRYNSPLDNTNSLIWKTKAERTTYDKKFYIMSYQSPGIEWLCLENSPCHDITPQNIFAPDFFLKLLVSNSSGLHSLLRGVDSSTYCDYQLIFILHMHGLPLSGKRSLFIVIVSTSLLVGLVVFYIMFCLLWPHVVKAWVTLRWKINNILASESYYTYATSNAAFSFQSRSGSEASSKAPSKAGSKETTADRNEVAA